ncbi:MAG: ribosome-associated translation inhibitor RaiA [Candidatus Marinimicrobia bacterium]|nr:ribosome-associated translation inhibitor RaiA [Candidatus Neomarinimicrobiota bacterium]MCD6099012.1 ribosome-associated translation inhibitor RaiA [Candidatus Neomarinimicrobiota bacterium]
MLIEITSRHNEVSEKVRGYLKEKIEKLGKFFPNIVSCKVVLDSQKEGEVVDITMHVSGKDFVTKVISDNIVKSIDLAVHKIENQLRKFKEKRYEK